MIQLDVMTPDEFSAFLERNIREYAAEKVKAGNWLASEAEAKSRSEHETLLPGGLSTPDNHLYSIRQGPGAPQAGTVWLAVERNGSRADGFVYDLFVFEGFRRRGVARGAMLALENRARELGLQRLGLHVFAHNRAARALYDSLGFEATNLVLTKKLC